MPHDMTHFSGMTSSRSIIYVCGYNKHVFQSQAPNMISAALKKTIPLAFDHNMVAVFPFDHLRAFLLHKWSMQLGTRLLPVPDHTQEIFQRASSMSQLIGKK